MTDFELLELIFPADIACKILCFRSHPTADLLKGMIHEWKHFKKLSCRGLLGFNHYCRNKRTLRWAERDMLYVNGSVNRGLIEEHLTYVPFRIRHPETCSCRVCCIMNVRE